MLAKLLYVVGLALVVWGVYEEGGALLEILVQDNLVGSFISTVVDCIVNKLMIQICFVDLIFGGLVKMRFFNGYMADDVVLTSFCLLAGYSADLNKQFVSGAREREKEVAKSRLTKRSRSLPPVNLKTSTKKADARKAFLKQLENANVPDVKIEGVAEAPN